jgi:hypothetical protein
MSKSPFQTIGVLEPNSPPDISACLTRIVQVLKRYIAFPAESQAYVVAVWVAHSWGIDSFDYTPYLHIYSPEKRCGKTLVLDILKMLIPNPWSVVGPSTAVLFRAIDAKKPTILFDEIDTVFNAKDERSEGLRCILNKGFQRGGSVPRCVGTENEIRDFSIFCAKVLAGIGTLPDTVADRSIPIKLARKTRAQTVSRFRERLFKCEAEEICEVMKSWAESPEIQKALLDARPSMPEELGDRQMDVCEPLIAIADLAGGDWPTLIRTSLVELYSASQSDETSIGALLLRDIKRVFESSGLNRIKTSDLIEALFDLEESPWAGLWELDWKRQNIKGPSSKLARLLKPYGISSKTMRFADNAEAKGYEEAAFIDAWARYL